MKIKNENIDENIYAICVLINKICRLDVEFIGNGLISSLQLVSSQIPISLVTSRVKTFTYIDKISKNNLPTDFLYYTDSFKLSYISVGFHEELQYKGTIIVGPFLCDIPDDAFIASIIQTNHLPLGNRLQLHQYYKGVSLVDINNNKNIGSLIINLASNPFIHGNMLLLQNEPADINKKETDYFKEEEEEFHSEIELRYIVETNLLNAVEKGSKKDALRIWSLFQFSAIHRAPNNPLRAYKNLTFSFNTLLRIASARGGVSSIYIHNLSDKFAILVEKVSSIADIENLQLEMISEYCDLVNKFSTAGYSGVVKKAINYINLNFHETLSLSLIANNSNVSPSHLSRQFKKETNFTITEFLNKRRVNEAKFLIEQNTNSITEIALMVGFETHNYFCTVFKQITSLTPKEYLNKTRTESQTLIK